MFGDAHPQVIIHCKIERRVKRTKFLPVFGAKEHCLLGDVNVSAPQFGIVCLARGELSDNLSFFIYKIAIGIDHRHVGIGNQKVDRICDGVRSGVGIIGVEPGKDVTFGAIKAFVDGVCLAFILDRLPLFQFPGILLNHIHTAVGRAAIHDDVLDMRISLPEHGLDRCFEEIRLVE